MTKADIINEIAEKTGVDKADVTASVEAFFSVIKGSMANGNNIYIRGFGSVINKKRKKKIALVLLIPFNDFFREISCPHPLDYQFFSIFIFKSGQPV